MKSTGRSGMKSRRRSDSSLCAFLDLMYYFFLVLHELNVEDPILLIVRLLGLRKACCGRRARYVSRPWYA